MNTMGAPKRQKWLDIIPEISLEDIDVTNKTDDLTGILVIISQI